MKSKYGEIRTNYTDEDENITYVDAWKSANDNEDGIVIAKIHRNTKKVEYLDTEARYDPYAQDEIKAVLTDLPE